MLVFFGFGLDLWNMENEKMNTHGVHPCSWETTMFDLFRMEAEVENVVYMVAKRRYRKSLERETERDRERRNEPHTQALCLLIFSFLFPWFNIWLCLWTLDVHIAWIDMGSHEGTPPQLPRALYFGPLIMEYTHLK